MSDTKSGVLKGCILAVFLGGVVTVIAASVLWTLRPAPTPDQMPSAGPAGPTGSRAVDAPPPGTAALPPPVPAGAAVARVKQRGRLVVGMDTGEPPMSGTPPMFFVDSQGGRDGFDYALSRRIADAVGVPEVEIVHARYSELAGVLADSSPKVDLLISGYSPTDEAGIAWSTPYLEYGLCLVVTASSSVRTTQDLTGKKVGIFDDDSAAEEVQKLVKGYTELVRMEDGYWEALLAGRFDGFLYDYPYAAAELQKFYAAHPDKRGAFRIAQYNLTDSTYAVGVRAGDADLLATVNAAIEAWMVSPEYGVAVKRYLKGGEATALTEVKGRQLVVKAGDTLSGIAQRELGATTRWREIWDLNRSRFPNPHLIEVGDTVVLPAK